MTTEATESTFLEALAGIIRQANSAEAWEAQNILLRRLALQGDVIGSRVPAPKNISEIGGYINLLTELQQTEMRSQTLAGILGVAGPNPPLGWTSNKPVYAIVSLVNDRPDGAAQPMTPLSVAIRSDFAEAFQNARKALHDRGCLLPLLSSWLPLPPSEPGATAPADVLPYLGRALDLVPAAALRDPNTDALALARPYGSTQAYELVARVIEPGVISVPEEHWEALQCDDTSCAAIEQAEASFVPIAPVLAAAGYYPVSPLPLPATSKSVAWARLNNITNLVPGVTRLGDELARLYIASAVAASVFAGRTHWIWNGSSFVEPT